MRDTASHDYTDEHIQFLVDASKTNVSYHQMAVDFNARFGTRLSRNSILGKCSRLGLRGSKEPSKHRQLKRRPTASPKRLTPFRQPKRYALARAASQSPAPDRSLEERLLRPEGGRASEAVSQRVRFNGTVDDVFDPVSHAKPFLELRKGECKWPAASDASMACGAKATIGSYCTCHARVAYRTMPTVSRNRRVLAGGGYLDTPETFPTVESVSVQAPLLIPSFLHEEEQT